MRLVRAVSSAAGSVPLVLVVTPSATDRTMLRSCLQDAYRVMEAADTPSALELIQRYHSHLSVVLLDQSLADKTEAVLTYLYETLTAQSIPMLLLGKPDCNVGAVSPADGIITRPLLPETLRQQVAQAIRQNRRSDPEK